MLEVSIVQTIPNLTQATYNIMILFFTVGVSEIHFCLNVERAAFSRVMSGGFMLPLQPFL